MNETEQNLRAAFERALEAARERYPFEDEQAEFDRAVIAEWRALGKKPARSPADERRRALAELPAERVEALRAPYMQRATAWRERASEASQRANAIADELTPAAGPLAFELGVVYASTYSTQTRPGSYVRGAAERLADVAREYQIPVEVVPGNVPGDLHVVAHVASQLDGEVLARKPGPPLREQVRRCWARGVNPRVYLPGLPHGYEERNGFDFQGREVQR